MKNKILGHLDTVHAAIVLGCKDNAEICRFTGLRPKQVSNVRWHLNECNNDIEEARRHRSAMSKHSRSKRAQTDDQSDPALSVIEALEANGHLAAPHAIAQALARSYRQNISYYSQSAKLEEVGQCAFYLSDLALEARTF